MTIPAQVPKNSYTASGSPTFIYAFKITDASELLVYVDGLQVVSGLTVTGIGNSAGGTVTISPTPANGLNVTLLRGTIRAQSTDWTANDPDPAEAKEQAFDRGMAIQQEQDEILNRTPQYKPTNSGILTPKIDTPDVGKFATAKDAAGNIGWATPVPSGSLNNPVSLAQGGTGASYASRAALVKGLGLAIWGNPLTDIIDSFGVTAGVLQVPNPCSNNVTFINNNLSGILQTSTRAGTILYLYFSSIVTLTHSNSFYLLGQKDATMATDTISAFFQTTGGWIEIDRFVIGNATNRFQFWRGDGTYQMPPMPEATRLAFVSGTSIKLNPFKGRLLPVKASGSWQQRDIGSGGISSGNPTTASNFVNGVAAQTLAADTTYLVCVFDNAGVLTFDFLTTLTHTQDAATGVEIKNGDDSRTVVGMVRTNATPNFKDDNGLRGVISWFNRRDIGIVNGFTANRSKTSVTYVEIDIEIRANFLTWGDEAVTVIASGAVAVPNTFEAYTSVAFDGTTAEDAMSRISSASGSGISPLALSLVKNGLSEGSHYATLLGGVSGSTGTWSGGSVGGTRCSLTVGIRG